MFLQLKRMLTVGIAASVAFVGFSAAPQAAQAAPSASAVSKASKWLVAHPATTDDGYLYKVYNATGIAAAQAPGSGAALRTRVRELRDGAQAAVAAKPTLAPYLAILVDALHLSPRKFGGVDLVSTIRSSVTNGDYSYAYGQALAIIALKRSGAAVPSTLVGDLIAGQTKTGPDAGAFGYSDGTTFFADPDSTALAIQALDLVGRSKYSGTVRLAAAWAVANQTKEGFWGKWSPVDSTALMATALTTVKPSAVKGLKVAASHTKAYRWLKTQQLGDGGFPASLGGTTSDQMATFDAVFLLKGKVWSTFTYKLGRFTTVSAPKIVGTKKVGSTLSVKLGTWRPKLATNTTVSYRWLRSGKAIPGATAATYTLVAADAGKHVRVKVTVSEVGLKTVTKVSAATKKIAA